MNFLFNRYKFWDDFSKSFKPLWHKISTTFLKQKTQPKLINTNNVLPRSGLTKNIHHFVKIWKNKKPYLQASSGGSTREGSGNSAWDRRRGQQLSNAWDRRRGQQQSSGSVDGEDSAVSNKYGGGGGGGGAEKKELLADEGGFFVKEEKGEKL